MLKIGLTGGIASGKTTISNLFSALGVPVIDTDIISRQLLEIDQPGYPEVVSHFGRKILLENKQIDRRQLRHLVFSDSSEKEWLEALLHPVIYEQTRQQIDEYKTEQYVIVVIGEITTKSAIARFSRTLETMSTAGVPLVEAMESVAGATGNIIYFKASMKIRDEVSQGTQLQTSMRNTGLFPNMAIQMVSIGEESGSLDAMLAKVADFYEAEVDNAVDALTSLLEPIIMAVLGVLVGGLIIAMYLPIFKLGAVV